MNIECNKCRANNEIGNLFIECVNCRADLNGIYFKKTFFNNLLKVIIATIILTSILLLAYEFQLRNKIFPPTPRHSTIEEYKAVDGCMETIQVHSGKTEEKLHICTQALERLQQENSNITEINPRMINGYAEVILSQK